jgi:hypothetical protein
MDTDGRVNALPMISASRGFTSSQHFVQGRSWGWEKWPVTALFKEIGVYSDVIETSYGYIRRQIVSSPRTGLRPKPTVFPMHSILPERAGTMTWKGVQGSCRTDMCTCFLGAVQISVVERTRRGVNTAIQLGSCPNLGIGWHDKIVTQGYIEVSGGHLYAVRYNGKRRKVVQDAFMNLDPASSEKQVIRLQSLHLI